MPLTFVGEIALDPNQNTYFCNENNQFLANSNSVNIACSFKFLLKESIVNTPRITDHGSTV
jgi:hypothetical protein